MPGSPLLEPLLRGFETLAILNDGDSSDLWALLASSAINARTPSIVLSSVASSRPSRAHSSDDVISGRSKRTIVAYIVCSYQFNMFAADTGGARVSRTGPNASGWFGIVDGVKGGNISRFYR